MTEKIKVFVYGTLRTGEGNWKYFLKDNPNVEKLDDDKIHGYVMIHLGGFPAIIPVESYYSENELPIFDEDCGEFLLNHPIVGEVFEVDSLTLRRLDGLEGYNGNGSGLYDRKKVFTEKNHKAYVYFMNEPRKNRPVIENGDWIRSGGKKW